MPSSAKAASTAAQAMIPAMVEELRSARKPVGRWPPLVWSAGLTDVRLDNRGGESRPTQVILIDFDYNNIFM